MGWILVKESGHKYPRLVQTSSGGAPTKEEAIKRYKSGSGSTVKVVNRTHHKTPKKVMYVEDPVRQETRPATPYEQAYYEEHGKLPQTSSLKEEFLKKAGAVEKPRVEHPVRVIIHDTHTHQTREATKFETSYYQEHGRLPVVSTPYEQAYLDTLEGTTTREGIVYTIRKPEREYNLDKERQEYLEARRKYRAGKISDYEYAKEMSEYEQALNQRIKRTSQKIEPYIETVGRATMPLLPKNVVKGLSKGTAELFTSTYYGLESSDLLVDKAIFAGHQYLKMKGIIRDNSDYVNYKPVEAEFKQAGKRTVKVLASQYNPLEAKNWPRIALTVTSVEGLAEYKASQLANRLPEKLEVKSYSITAKDFSGTKSFTISHSKNWYAGTVSDIKNLKSNFVYVQRLPKGRYRTIFATEVEGKIKGIETIATKKGEILSQRVLGDLGKSQTSDVDFIIGHQYTIQRAQQISPNEFVRSVSKITQIAGEGEKYKGIHKISSEIKGVATSTSEVRVYASDIVKEVKLWSPGMKEPITHVTKYHPKFKLSKEPLTTGEGKTIFTIGKEEKFLYLTKEFESLTKIKHSDVVIKPSSYSTAELHMKQEVSVPYIFGSSPGFTIAKLMKKPKLEVPVPKPVESNDFLAIRGIVRNLKLTSSVPKVKTFFNPASLGIFALTPSISRKTKQQNKIAYSQKISLNLSLKKVAGFVNIFEKTGISTKELTKETPIEKTIQKQMPKETFRFASKQKLNSETITKLSYYSNKPSRTKGRTGGVGFFEIKPHKPLIKSHKPSKKHIKWSKRNPWANVLLRLK